MRWDNVGFDGPVVGGWREASVPDALDPTADGEGLRTGYTVPAAENGESVRLEIPAVNLAGATAARLALSAQYPWFEWNGVNHPPTYFNLRFRLNGGAWHDRHVNDVEANAFQSFSGDSGAAGPGCSARSSSSTSPSCATGTTRWTSPAPTSGPAPTASASSASTWFSTTPLVASRKPEPASAARDSVYLRRAGDVEFVCGSGPGRADGGGRGSPRPRGR